MGVTVLQGDCRDVLATLPAESVQCVVTSPPYFGLRDYGVVGQIGLEQTPKEYVEQMVSVFREIRRVLRKDGVAWLNLGDSYSGYHGNKNAEMPTSALNGWTNGTNENLRTTTANRNGIKPKDLLMIPARVAIALCDDGWYLRSEIVWAKPNPMPESVTDRPTRAHEMVYLLSKSQTYFYDADAISEPVIKGANGSSFLTGKTGINGMGRNSTLDRIEKDTKNKRSVWTVSAQAYPDSHFAVMPEKLVEPCILAGSRIGDIVLDPFAGSGTVLRVATKHRRNAIGIELNPDYCDLIEKRTSRVQQTLPMEEAV